MFRPVLDAVAGSLFITALVAMLPLLALFILLGVVRMRAWLASLIALAVSILVAVTAYSMPIGQAVLAGTEGAAFGFFPILWIVINAIWIYNILNPEPARELGDRKATNVLATGAEVLVTANPGCLMQVASSIERAGGHLALAHTVEVLDASIRGLSPAGLGVS